MKRHKKITRTPGEWVLDIVKVVFLAFVVVVTVYPFWNIFIISINERNGCHPWRTLFPSQKTEP